MKLYHDVKRAPCFGRFLQAVDAHIECVWKVAKIPVDVFTDVGSQCRQITGPRMSPQVNIRADVQLLYRHSPCPLLQVVRQHRSESSLTAQLAELKHETATV